MTEIGFGTWAWGNKLLWGYSEDKSDEVLKATFHKAISGNLTFIDTADSYGTGRHTGRSESLLGCLLEEIPINKRKNITVTTKLAPFPWRVGREGFKKPFFNSQKRLKGHLNIVQLHWSTARYAPWQEGPLLNCLADFVEQGLVNGIGVSNVGPRRLRWMHNLLAERNIPIHNLQVQFSLLSPNPLKEQKLFETCKELNIKIVAYSPLALGTLSLPPEADIPIKATILRKELLRNLMTGSKHLREVINLIANNKGVTQTQVALNWCRAHGAIPIPGLRTPKQAIEASKSQTWNLTKKEVQLLDKIRLECSVRMPSNPFQSN